MKKQNNAFGFITLSILLIIIIPIIWFIFDINDIPSKLGMPINKIPGKWSTVLIGYMASVLTAITGFIATAYSVNKNITNQNMIRKKDNALAALPLIKVNASTNSCDTTIICKYDSLDNENEKTFSLGNIGLSYSPKFEIKNVGQREMYNIRAYCIKTGHFLESNEAQDILPILYKNDGATIGLDIRTAITNDFYDGPIEIIHQSDDFLEKALIKIIYDDCYKNTYSQIIELCLSYDVRKHNKITYKFFDRSTIKNYKIITPPIKQQNIK